MGDQPAEGATAAVPEEVKQEEPKIVEPKAEAKPEAQPVKAPPTKVRFVVAKCGKVGSDSPHVFPGETYVNVTTCDNMTFSVGPKIFKFFKRYEDDMDSLFGQFKLEFSTD